MRKSFGIFLLLLCLCLAVFGPSLAPSEFDAIHLSQTNLAPSAKHWFGTDDLGRDLFARTAIGLRLSLATGIVAACIDCLIGALWGASAAMLGRKYDMIMMRFVDSLAAIPQTILAIVMLVCLGPGFLSMICAMVIAGWLTMARIMRSYVATLVNKEYVLASRLIGAGYGRVLRMHILPNSTDIILTTLLMTIPQAIFLESFLSFLGLGVPPPASSLGSMAQEALPALSYYPWRMLIPAGCVSVVILGFNLIAKQADDRHGK
ncbi:MAG: ABC transporter permease [Parachlamydiales bacterium]|jgi:oligopeptide transport system permease protein